MRKVVKGSIAELMDLIAAGECKGDVSELCSAFSDRVYCHRMKQALPLVMATALTPFHTKHTNMDGHAVCEIHCGRACHYVDYMTNIAGDEVIAIIHPFKLGSSNQTPTRREMFAAGKFGPAASGMQL